MNEWHDAYLKHLNVLGYSPETIASHQWRLKLFFDFLRLQDIQEPTGITPNVVRNYQVFTFEKLNKQGKQNNVSYRNNLLEVAKRFLTFLTDEGVLTEDPGDGVKVALEPKRLPRYVLTQTEMRRLLNAPDTSSALGYRDKTILEVFYTNGIRRSELINLKLTDIDLQAGILRVNAGKGNKDRVVPLGKVAIRYLRNYIREVRPLLVKHAPNDYIFLSERGNKMCKCLFGLRLKQYAKQAGIEKDISVHTLRATCATHCIQGKKRKQQMHPRHLMELLGHSSMEALNPYLSLSIADLKEAHTRCHPREGSGLVK